MSDSQMRSPTPAPPDRRPVDQTSHLDWKLLPPDRLELARKFLSDIPLYMESVSPLYWSSDRFYLWLYTYSYSTLAKKATFTPEVFFEAWTSALAVLYSFPPYGTHPDEIALAYYREMKVGTAKYMLFFFFFLCRVRFSSHCDEQEKPMPRFFLVLFFSISNSTCISCTSFGTAAVKWAGVAAQRKPRLILTTIRHQAVAILVCGLGESFEVVKIGR